MKISLEFEKRLIELFGSEHVKKNNTFEKILEPNSKKNNYDKIVNEPGKKVKHMEESQNLPSGFTLFMGIGIGIGLASHAVLTKTD
tara:strand:+ start:123 stop:380 length:258 start_codon:yes stop_codon:yes gene_type:complete